jgi:hypothetical protein
MVLNFGHVHPKSVFGVPQVSGAFYLTGGTRRYVSILRILGLGLLILPHK